MLRLQALIGCTLALGIVSCRASFQDIQKPGLVSSGDGLGAQEDKGIKGGKDATPQDKPQDSADDYPILENVKELPPEDSESYGCNGIVVVYEKGKDRNRDGILQPTEVTDIRTECRPKPPGKDPENPDKPMDPPSQCPNQSKDPSGKCPDDPKQNDASQAEQN